MFGEIEKGQIIGKCEAHLAQKGIRVEQVEDFDRIPYLMKQSKKTYLTPIVSPLNNCLTQGNCIWLVGWLGDQPAMIGGARLEDLGDETVASFWPRSLGRLYNRPQAELIENVSNDISHRLSGKLAYYGDLHVMPGMRGMLSNLRSFITIGHLAVSLKWNPDHIYAFLRENDVMRGAAARYGFLDVFPRPMAWKNPPEPRSSNEWCGVLSRRKLPGMARATAGSVDLARVRWAEDHAISDEYDRISELPSVSVT